MSVCLSVCPMFDPKSRMEGKIGRKEAHDTGDESRRGENSLVIRVAISKHHQR